MLRLSEHIDAVVLVVVVLLEPIARIGPRLLRLEGRRKIGDNARLAHSLSTRGDLESIASS